MKAPAMRILRTRVHNLANIQCREAEKDSQSNWAIYNRRANERRASIHAALQKAVGKNLKKFVEFNPDKGGFVGTDAYDELQKSILATHPEVEYFNKCADIQIASLDLHLHVPLAKLDAWKKFAKECDDAFLNDDAKAVLESLEALLG